MLAAAQEGQRIPARVREAVETLETRKVVAIKQEQEPRNLVTRRKDGTLQSIALSDGRMVTALDHSLVVKDPKSGRILTVEGVEFMKDGSIALHNQTTSLGQATLTTIYRNDGSIVEYEKSTFKSAYRVKYPDGSIAAFELDGMKRIKSARMPDGATWTPQAGQAAVNGCQQAWRVTNADMELISYGALSFEFYTGCITWRKAVAA